MLREDTNMMVQAEFSFLFPLPSFFSLTLPLFLSTFPPLPFLLLLSSLLSPSQVSIEYGLVVYMYVVNSQNVNLQNVNSQNVNSQS